MQKETQKQSLVVITGASGALGQALVNQYIRKGFKVAALDVRYGDLQKFSAEFPSHFQFFDCDVTNESIFNKVTESIVQTMGRPDIWINNAGCVTLNSFEKQTPDAFKKVFDVNFWGVVLGTRCALSAMRNPERGAIVNVASLNGVIPAPFMTSYVSAKHAVVGFTRALQEEHSQMQSALQISLVLPGFFESHIMSSQNGFAFPKWLNWMISSAESTAQQTIQGIVDGQSEIITTQNGKILFTLQRVLPKTMRSSSRFLVAKNWREILGLSPIGR